jgi:hypothetical protein
MTSGAIGPTTLRIGESSGRTQTARPRVGMPGTLDRMQYPRLAGFDDLLPAVEEEASFLEAPLDTGICVHRDELLWRRKHFGMLGRDHQCRLGQAGLSDLCPDSAIEIGCCPTTSIRVTPLEGGIAA